MTTLEIAHRMFREQHRLMIEDQKRLLDEYKNYFDGVLHQMENQERQKLPSKAQQEADMMKEIAELGVLLEEAVTTYGKEITEIVTQLTERQRETR